MADQAVNKRGGARPKPGDKKRDIQRQQQYTVAEWERIEWAADELALSPAAYIRMAVLLHAKGVVG